MSNSGADRNLLFGILALQMDFVSRDALIAAWSVAFSPDGRRQSGRHGEAVGPRQRPGNPLPEGAYQGGPKRGLQPGQPTPRQRHRGRRNEGARTAEWQSGRVAERLPSLLQVKK
jgi:hypothetical protein